MTAYYPANLLSLDGRTCAYSILSLQELSIMSSYSLSIPSLQGATDKIAPNGHLCELQGSLWANRSWQAGSMAV